MWVDAYRPGSLDAFKGKAKTVAEVKEWVEEWSPDQKQTSLLLHGPPGCGKTSLVEILADELGRELFETNASEARTKDAVREKLLQAATQASFTGKDKLILVDEVDGMGRGDRGGRKVLNEVVKKSRYPVILTANDPYANGMRTLRNKSKVVELGKVHTNSVAAALRDICEAEGVEYEDGAIKTIARRADGDLRSAINDLQSIAATGMVTGEAVNAAGYRETGRDIFEALKIVFKTTSVSNARDATEGVDEDYDTLFEWIRENVPKEYARKTDRARAFEVLSQADVFRGRIRSGQNWSLLKYVYTLMTAGVAVAKEQKYSGFTRYGYPSKIRRMGQSRGRRAVRDGLGEKIGDHLHISVSTATDLIPFLQLLFEREDWKQDIVAGLELNEKELEYIESY